MLLILNSCNEYSCKLSFYNFEFIAKVHTNSHWYLQLYIVENTLKTFFPVQTCYWKAHVSSEMPRVACELLGHYQQVSAAVVQISVGHLADLSGWWGTKTTPSTL